jgi:dihydroflavonol-4-reductase
MADQDKILFFHTERFPGSEIFNALNSKYPGAFTGFIHTGGAMQQKENVIYGDAEDLFLLDVLLKDFNTIICCSNFIFPTVSFSRKNIGKEKDITAGLVNTCLSHNIRYFLYLSNVNALGIRKLEEKIGENHILSHSKFDSSTAIGAFLSEQEVWRGHAEGLPATILNAGYLISDSDNKNNPFKMLCDLVLHTSRKIPTGTNIFTGLDDLTGAIEKCLSRNIIGERFIIGSENISYINLTQKIYGCLGINERNRQGTDIISKIHTLKNNFAALFGRGSSIIPGADMVTESLSVLYDNNKSVAQLGLKYTPVDIVIKNALMRLYPDSVFVRGS